MTQEEKHEQRSPEWFKARSGKVTGSVAGAILEVNKWMKRADVMRSMVRNYNGLPNEFKTNDAMTWGTFNEDNAIASMESEHDIEVIETGFHTHPEHTWLGASPDGFIDDDSVAEIKCPYFVRDSGEFKPIEEQPSYYAQVQLEMYCTGRALCYFYQWSLVKTHLTIIEIDQVWLKDNIPKLKQFHDEYLVERNNPDKYNAIDLSEDKQLVDLMHEYVEISNQINEITRRKKDITQQIHERADLINREIHINGCVIKKQSRKGSIDYNQLIKGLDNDIDLEEYRKKDSEFWVIKLK